MLHVVPTAGGTPDVLAINLTGRTSLSVSENWQEATTKVEMYSSEKRTRIPEKNWYPLSQRARLTYKYGTPNDKRDCYGQPAELDIFSYSARNLFDSDTRHVKRLPGKAKMSTYQTIRCVEVLLC